MADGAACSSVQRLTGEYPKNTGGLNKLPILLDVDIWYIQWPTIKRLLLLLIHGDCCLLSRLLNVSDIDQWGDVVKFSPAVTLTAWATPHSKDEIREPRGGLDIQLAALEHENRMNGRAGLPLPENDLRPISISKETRATYCAQCANVGIDDAGAGFQSYRRIYQLTRTENWHDHHAACAPSAHGIQHLRILRDLRILTDAWNTRPGNMCRRYSRHIEDHGMHRDWQAGSPANSGSVKVIQGIRKTLKTRGQQFSAGRKPGRTGLQSTRNVKNIVTMRRRLDEIRISQIAP